MTQKIGSEYETFTPCYTRTYNSVQNLHTSDQRLHLISFFFQSNFIILFSLHLPKLYNFLVTTASHAIYPLPSEIRTFTHLLFSTMYISSVQNCYIFNTISSSTCPLGEKEETTRPTEMEGCIYVSLHVFLYTEW